MLITHPQATYFLRARGHSMIDAGIFDNYILVVDRAIKPRHTHVVVAIVDGDLTVKYLDDKGGNKYQLQAFMRGSNLHALWYSGIIKSMVEESDAMTARLLKRKTAFAALKWSAVRAAEQSCQIVGGPGFTRNGERGRAKLTDLRLFWSSS